MKAAMIFPGQGSQYVGMGKDLVERFPRVRDLYNSADDVLGFSISGMCFEGDQEVLKETRNAQPAILLHSIAAERVLKEEAGIEPTIVAGHSLGEYSALVAAGVLSWVDALRIVRRRGELMYDAGLEQPGSMAAVIGQDRTSVEEICGICSVDEEIVVVANINSPGQIVISGHRGAVERAMGVAGERGAKKVVRLNVSGAFHSPLVAGAQKELVDYINTFDIRDAGVGVISNAGASVVRSREEIVEALSRQLTSPVLWSDSMSVLNREWKERIIEVGPGRVLKGLMRRIERDRDVETAGTAGELEKLIEAELEIV